MATQSEVVAEVFDGHLPIWLNVETDAGVPEPHLRVTARCKDGDVLVLDVLRQIVIAPGRSDRLAVTKQELLSQTLDLLNTQLGLLALERD